MSVNSPTLSPASGWISYGTPCSVTIACSSTLPTTSCATSPASPFARTLITTPSSFAKPWTASASCLPPARSPRSATSVLALPRTRDTVFVEAVDQGAARDAEELGGARLVAGAFVERLEDPLLLELGDGRADLARHVGGRRCHDPGRWWDRR